MVGSSKHMQAAGPPHQGAPRRRKQLKQQQKWHSSDPDKQQQKQSQSRAQPPAPPAGFGCQITELELVTGARLITPSHAPSRLDCA